MKTFYLISEHTKEHIRWTPDMPMSAPGYKTVEADSKGWIAWDCEAGLDCPLSEEQSYQARLRSGSIVDSVVRWYCYNNHGDVMAYRPILSEKVQEPEQTAFQRQCAELQTERRRLRNQENEYAEKEAERKHMEIKEAELKRMMLLDRLKAAHKAAQTIPDLEAELREVLGSMGYTLGKLSPFVDDEAELAEDMNDWRNWRFGDTVIDSQLDCMATRQVIRIEDPDYIGEQPVELTHSQKHYWPHIKNLTWHSRPAQE